MEEFLDAAIPGLGVSIGMEKLRAKRRGVVIGHMFDDYKRPSIHDDDDEDADEDVESNIHDPDSPGYRPPQPTEKPSPRAQWDDAGQRWIIWDKEANDWVACE